MSDKAESPREFISTAQAAKQLGLSLGAVQQMVECGTLAGWKTAGGHRRIRQDSVDALLARARSPGLQPRAGSANSKVRLLVVEDDRLLQGIYRETFAAWDSPLDVRIIGHGLDALVEVGREPPDLLIADLRIPGIDGFEMIRRLRAAADRGPGPWRAANPRSPDESDGARPPSSTPPGCRIRPSAGRHRATGRVALQLVPC